MKAMEGSYFAHLRSAYLFINKSLIEQVGNEKRAAASLPIQHMARAAWLKLRKWYSATDTDVLAVAAVMDPRIKIAFFENKMEWPVLRYGRFMNK